jgi:hypothetical protein
VYAVYEDNAASMNGFVNKATCVGHPNEDIFMMCVLNRDAHVLYARLWVLGSDRFGTN